MFIYKKKKKFRCLEEIRSALKQLQETQLQMETENTF